MLLSRVGVPLDSDMEEFSAAMRVLSPVLTLDLPSRPVGKRNPVCMVKTQDCIQSRGGLDGPCRDDHWHLTHCDMAALPLCANVTKQYNDSYSITPLKRSGATWLDPFEAKRR